MDNLLLIIVISFLVILGIGLHIVPWIVYGKTPNVVASLLIGGGIVGRLGAEPLNTTPPKLPITVYYYYADWCGYCQKFNHVWEQLKASLPRINFVKIGEKESRDARVPSFPTIRMQLHNDDRLFTYTGVRTVDELTKWIMSPHINY